MTLRAIITAIFMSIISILWMHQSAITEGGGIIYALSVPPVPAIFCMLFLLAVQPILERLSVRRYSRAELIVIFMFLVLAIPQTSYGVVELLLPWMTSHTYFATPQNGLAQIAAELPAWYGPQSPELIRQMYEGGAGVPWDAWMYPLAMWTGFMALMFFTGYCLVNIFRKQWVDSERLRFPLLFIPQSLVEREAPGSHVPFFRNPLVWTAVLLVMIHHGLNVAHAYNPSVTALQDRSYIGRIFTENPWTAYNNVRVFHRPQTVGLAYFVSPDLLFSTWFFFLLQPTLRVFAQMFGLSSNPSFPFRYQQGAGAYFALIFALTYIGRDHILKVLRRAVVGDESIDDSDERLPYRPAVYGAFGGFAAMIIWAQMSGFSPMWAGVYFFLLLGFGLVYARVRAEGGVPAMWAFPFNQHKEGMFYLLGTKTFINGTDTSDLVMLNGFSWMGRGYYMSQMGYQIENEALADRFDIRSRWFAAFTVFAFLVGCVVAYYVTLTDYYQFGAVVLGGGTTAGGSNVYNARRSWEEVGRIVLTPSGPNVSYSAAIIVGSVVALGLMGLRRFWLQSPFHPLGYAISLNYGYALWAPFFFAWLAKLIIQRIGGARLYRQMMPFFLGLAIGDLLAGGLAWLALWILGPDALAGYVVMFG